MNLKNPLNQLFEKVKFYILPTIMVICIVLAILVGGGVMQWVLKIVGSILGGLMIAGFFTVVLTDQEDARLLGIGVGFLVPLLAVLTFIFGWAWLTIFLPYTGILTLVLLFLDGQRRRWEKENKQDK